MTEIETCESKIRFETRDRAHRFAAKIRQRGMSAQRAYHCPVCGDWHLATKRRPIEIPAAPAEPTGRLRDLARACVETCEQVMRRTELDGSERVIVSIEAGAWDALARQFRAE